MLKKPSHLSSLTENKIMGKYLQNRSCIVFAQALDLHNNDNIHIDRQKHFSPFLGSWHLKRVISIENSTSVFKI